MQQRELNSFHVLHCWWKCSAEFWRKTLKAFKIGCDLFPSDCQDTSSGDIYWIWGANLDREREEGLNIQTNENFGVRCSCRLSQHSLLAITIKIDFNRYSKINSYRSCMIIAIFKTRKYSCRVRKIKRFLLNKYFMLQRKNTT